jgi:murein DD-endopeptidase MepM/ murein hydrolase activator NlpD
MIVFLHCSKSDNSNPNPNTQDFGCISPTTAEFVLPYPVGQSYTLSQGNCGSFNHVNELRYGFDFAMPVGSVVTAAQTGTVFFIEEGYEDGDHQSGHANMLIIFHEDNTYGRYLHLTKNGVMVDIGNIVNRGDTIALSGNTGYVEQPLLHFDVLSCNGCPSTNTLPVGYINADPPLKEEGISYLARPF